MKIKFLGLSILICVICLNNITYGQTTRKSQQPVASSTAGLDFLNSYKGKYPAEVKLLNQPVIKKRLQKLLGTEYTFLKKIWQVESPIEIDNGLFYAWAMQAHQGGNPGAVIMADIKKNILYVGIRKNGEEKFYSEDGSPSPKKMIEWANEQ